MIDRYIINQHKKKNGQCGDKTRKHQFTDLPIVSGSNILMQMIVLSLVLMETIEK